MGFNNGYDSGWDDAVAAARAGRIPGIGAPTAEPSGGAQASGTLTGIRNVTSGAGGNDYIALTDNADIIVPSMDVGDQFWVLDEEWERKTVSSVTFSDNGIRKALFFPMSNNSPVLLQRPAAEGPWTVAANDDTVDWMGSSSLFAGYGIKFIKVAPDLVVAAPHGGD